MFARLFLPAWENVRHLFIKDFHVHLVYRDLWSCAKTAKLSRFRLLMCSEQHPGEPYAGVGQALKKLRARGATTEELVDLVRGMQAELLFSFCYLLDDPG